MAHYIVTRTFDQPANQRLVQGFMYLSVPGGSNDVGIPWTSVAVGYTTWKNRRKGDTGTIASIPVDGATQTALNNGTLIELPFAVTISSSLTPAQAEAAIDSALAAQETARRNELAAELRYYGFQGDT